LSYFVEITVEQVLTLHQKAINRDGGDSAILNVSLIEGALNYMYLDTFSIPEIGGKLAYRINTCHAFQDGNKRTAFLSSLLFLRLNEYKYVARSQDAEYLFQEIAAGKKTELDCMAHFFHNAEKRK
jgi:death on curing protein